MRKNTKFFFLSIVFIIILFYLPCLAQQGVGNVTRNRAAQYYLGETDELVVPVNVWGFVMKPGQYMVPNNTDLIDLLSFAGGPIEGSKISKIHLVRSDDRLGNHVWKINVKKYLETGDMRQIPSLKPGDTVVVKGTTFHWISKFFEFVGRLAVFAQMFYFIAIAEERINR